MYHQYPESNSTSVPHKDMRAENWVINASPGADVLNPGYSFTSPVSFIPTFE